MARGRKGRAISGWLVVDKPAGVTSTAVVGLVRRALNAQKAGHAGTLDPDATGVLAVALGEATKTVPYVTDALKCYRFRIRLGVTTDTDDASGTVIATSDQRPDDGAIEAALGPFRGAIRQVPPQFSAVKVDGARAYDLAREGETMDLADRALWVERLSLEGRPDADHVDLEMVCGKGGYVRSIARDLGAALGCGAHVLWLRRLWSGPFDAADGVSLDDLHAGAPDLDSRLLPLETGLEGVPHCTATAGGAARLRNGNPGEILGADLQWGDTAWASFDGQAVAVGIWREGLLHPTRVFN